MTEDWINDAIDSLEESDCGYLLIAANYESPKCHEATNIQSIAHLEWMKRRFDEIYERLKLKLKP